MTVTTTLDVPVPPVPVAVAVYVVVTDGTSVTDPDGPFTPTPGCMSTEVALLEDQVNVVACPAVIVVGCAESCTVGPPFVGGAEVTVTVVAAVVFAPAAPLAVMVYVVLVVGVTVREPERLCAPIPGCMSIAVALAELQVKVATCPAWIDVGNAEI